jgi:hypothetical protein
MSFINAVASSSKTKIIDVIDAPFHAVPQPVFDYHSVDEQDPVICIDNGTLATFPLSAIYPLRIDQLS